MSTDAPPTTSAWNHIVHRRPARSRWRTRVYNQSCLARRVTRATPANNAGHRARGQERPPNARH
eukprot:8571382-Lingulodinium_polyedra.AAC.1